MKIVCVARTAEATVDGCASSRSRRNALRSSADHSCGRGDRGSFFFHLRTTLLTLMAILHDTHTRTRHRRVSTRSCRALACRTRYVTFFFGFSFLLLVARRVSHPRPCAEKDCYGSIESRWRRGSRWCTGCSCVFCSWGGQAITLAKDLRTWCLRTSAEHRRQAHYAAAKTGILPARSSARIAERVRFMSAHFALRASPIPFPTTNANFASFLFFSLLFSLL
jgi:hypothetical protein